MDPAGAPEAHESAWGAVEETMQDPEEMRVMFSALDSFAYATSRRCPSSKLQAESSADFPCPDNTQRSPTST